MSVTKKKTRSNAKRNLLKKRALEFAKVGVPVFPCRPRGKTPLTPHGFKDASTDPAVIEAWWRDRPDANIGIPTGAASEIVVLDVDVDKDNGSDGEASLRALEVEHDSLPRTFEVTTGGGGRHLWFRCPEGVEIGNSAGRLGAGLDVRGEGGYVIAPPSIHESGRSYRWIDGGEADSDIVDMPSWLADLLVTENQCTVSASASTGKIPRGKRNDTLFRRTRSLFMKGLDEATVRDAIRRENAECCNPPLSEGEVVGLLKSAARYRIQPAAESDTRPTIRVEAGQLARVVDQAENVLITAPDIQIFEHAGRLVSPIPQRRREAIEGVTRERGAIVLRPLSSTWLVEALTDKARWLKRTGVNQVDKVIDCPAKIAGTLLARYGRWKFPLLGGVVECPTLRADGSVIDRHGYDELSGLLLDFESDGFPLVPADPSPEDAKDALKVLKKLLVGFPFVSDADRSVALAAILTAPVRRSLCSAPLFAITAPTMGSGKTLLANVVSLIASGRDAAVMSQAKSGEEDRKRLLSILLANDLIVVIDNIERPLGGDTFCAILTQPTYRDRLLGENTAVTVETNAMFVATGNNLAVQGDMTRRTLMCTIDPRCERPDEREFDVDLRKFILTHRGELVGAVLTVLRAYVVAGKPKHPVQPYGSFEQWSDLVRSALVWLGEADPLDTRKKIEDADPVRRCLEAVLAAWWKVYKDEPVTMATVIGEVSSLEDSNEAESALRVALAEAIGDDRGALSSQKLGKWAQGVEGRIAGGFKLQRSKKTSSGVLKWKVVEVDQPTTNRGSGVAGDRSPRKKKNASKNMASGHRRSSADAKIPSHAESNHASPDPQHFGSPGNCEPEGWRHSERREEVTTATNYPVKLMVDSGAYSAFKQGVQIPLADYAVFLEANDPYVDTAVNLDVIPGSWGLSPEESAQQGWSNLKELECRGHHVIPVFHQGEDLYWLEKYRDEYPYIGISPCKSHGQATRRWLGECFETLAKRGAGQSIKTHAFGMTNFDWLAEFPWYSCDSSTWRSVGSFGGILAPRMTKLELPPAKVLRSGKRFQYVPWSPRMHFNERCRVVKVTERTRDRRNHCDNLSPENQRDVEWYSNFVTHSKSGSIANCHVLRAAANVRAFSVIERYLKRVHSGMFGRFIFATNLSKPYNALLSGILTGEDASCVSYDDAWYETPDGQMYGVPRGHFQPNRLLSYWLIRNGKKDKDPDFLRRFVTTGLMEDFEVVDKLGKRFEPQFDPRPDPSRT